MCSNNNNYAIINNNNCGMLQDFTLFFKIPMSTRKNFFEIYTQFRHAPWKKFCQPSPSVRCNTSWLCKDRQTRIAI